MWIQLSNPIYNLGVTSYGRRSHCIIWVLLLHPPFITSTMQILYPLVSGDLDRLKKHYLLGFGRLAAFKMLVLPKILYYFRTLPICIPNSLYQALQSKVSKFIWLNKRARCPLAILAKHRKAGGMGFSIFTDFHMATILGQLRSWIHQNYFNLWSQLEQASVLLGSLFLLLLIPQCCLIPSAYSHSIIAVALGAWDYYIKTHCSHSRITTIPLEALQFFLKE